MLGAQVKIETGEVKKASNSLHHAIKVMRKVEHYRENLAKVKTQLEQTKTHLRNHQRECDI